MTLLVCCGAAAACRYSAPLAGVLFCFEILLFNLTLGSIIPLLTASITATAVSSLIMGGEVSFASSTAPFLLANIPYYLVLGVVCGFVSLFFTTTTLFMESRISVIKNDYKRWALSALALGLLIVLFPPLYGEGYGSLLALLNNNVEGAVDSLIYGSISAWFICFLYLVLFLKVFAMSFTNAGGSRRHVWTTLFMGGVWVCIGQSPEPCSYRFAQSICVGGHAGLIGCYASPLTAIFCAELTGGYRCSCLNHHGRVLLCYRP